MHTFYFPEEIKEKYRHAIEKAREDRPRYFEWIKNEIETVINLLNQFDKKYILGGLGSRLIKSTPTLYNQFLETYDGHDKDELVKDELIAEDEEIEVLLEYAMSIAAVTPNTSNIIPTPDDIEAVYQQLSKIKSKINFWELSSYIPSDEN